MTVWLVGAGPGDPGLLTVRAAEVLARADVVIYDRLSVASLLDLAPREAVRISVGKTPGRPSTTQDEINSLLVEHGRTGARVVRLKGGDPFVFARGGEEAAALQAEGLDFEVVPGITSAIAVPAYAGIPVTLRHSSTSFTVVTGHEDPATDGQVDWEAIARAGGTLCVLMGAARWDRIAARLLAGGLAGDTPVAAVIWGTRPEQRTVRGTLGTLTQDRLASPAVIVVGQVAAVDLAWFERRPLFGRTVVVTRARRQASALSARLRDLGAQVVELPTIEIADPADGGAALRAATQALQPGDWLVLTSPNGAERLLAALPDIRRLGGVRVACIGPSTAAVLSAVGLHADLVPDQFVAESLLAAFPPPVGDERVVIARAAEARDVLPDGLRAAGYAVEVVEAYRTLPVAPSADALADLAAADAITFTSSSTLTNFVAAAGHEAVPRTVVSIGPITSQTARDAGFEVAAEADPHTIDGLVEAVRAALA